VKGITGDQGF